MGWVALLGLVFGAVDQYLGTTHVIVHTGAWVTTLSNLSALWLVLPFLAGWSRRTPKPSAAAGALVLATAFVGYWAMTLSPLEGVEPSNALRGILPLVTGHAVWLAGGAIGGPLFGVLGHRWRVSRAWTSVAAITIVLVGEPFAWLAAGLGQRFSDAGPVWAAEIVLGVCAAVAMSGRRLRGV